MSEKKKYLLAAASLVLFFIFVIWFWAYSIDDAFVTFRYAENLVNGYGLVYNPGDAPVEGYSNFLWLLILSLCYLIGLPTYLSAKVLGIIFFIGAAGIWLRHFRKDENNFLWMVPLLFLATPLTAFWAVSGLELGLYAFLVAGAFIQYSRKSKWAYLFLSLIVLCRPEGFIISIIMVGSFWYLGRRAGEDKLRFHIRGIGSVLFILILLILFRLAVFGYPMPNTFYAKSPTTLHGFLHLGKMLSFIAPLAIFFAVGSVILARRKFPNKELTIFAALVIVQSVISSLASQIMSFHLRYLIPFLPLLFAVAVYGIDMIRKKLWRQIILTLSILSIFGPTYSLHQWVQNEKKIIAAQMDFIRWAKNVPAETTFSITDAGRIPYYSRKHFYDIWGLTSGDIAHYGFKPLAEFLRFPDYFVFVGCIKPNGVSLAFGTEYLIFKNRDFPTVYTLAEVFRPEGADVYQKGYFYLLFEKNQAALDSLLKVRPLPK
ncbi:membrane hypothetical protein [Candidatus Zixiibacteriota bacterium]|nr:membrane hypothetical protein [candidate division Zixibacteria bacterium]